jgi:hypothetical protein
MKNNILNIALFLVLIAIADACVSQIIFPNGNEKKLITNQSSIYEVTNIPFIYPKGKVTDLSWQRVSDSFPSNWFIMACMNGTCLGGVPESGRFDNFLSNPDSLGFLKYHFSFNDIPGTAIIKFFIYNDLLLGAVGDTATFNITYVAPNAIKNMNVSSDVTVYPNPSSDFWTIQGERTGAIVSADVTDILGRRIISVATCEPGNHFSFQIENIALNKGIYFLKLQTDNSIQNIRLIKN